MNDFEVLINLAGGVNIECDLLVICVIGKVSVQKCSISSYWWYTKIKSDCFSLLKLFKYEEDCYWCPFRSKHLFYYW